MEEEATGIVRAGRGLAEYPLRETAADSFLPLPPPFLPQASSLAWTAFHESLLYTI